MSAQHYSVPRESEKVFREGILDNPLIAKDVPKEIREYGAKVQFEGTDAPVLPINWRFAESVSALKGFEATLVMALLKRKYNVDVEKVVVNTDHAQLFIMSVLIWTMDPDGENISAVDPKVLQHFPSNDIHRQQATLYRTIVSNIYKTKDGRFFHLHGSMNPDPSLDSLGLPHENDAKTLEDAVKPIAEKISQIDSGEMQRIISDVHKQAGTICWTTEEFKNSEHGKANAHVGLYEVREHVDPSQPAGWWDDAPITSAQRPLGGLKVVDLTRVIAAPTITRGLAELGASVMRVTAPHLADMSVFHCDLNWGKWNSHLDLRKEDDREKLRALILDADVVVTGYRPNVLDKYGFGEKDILDMCKDRKKGIIYVRENCYGWNGPWSYRSGWQQISDACCGVSLEYGRAMGNDEPVTPIFPNSDSCAGIAGICGVLDALMRRGEKGGSYSVDVALNYYSSWLVNSCGVYPSDVWDKLWSRYDKPVFRHYHDMFYTIPRMLGLLHGKAKDVLFKDEFFENRHVINRGITVRAVKPVLTFPNKEVKLGFNVGTRPNGVDQPHWPEDLLVETVA